MLRQILALQLSVHGWRHVTLDWVYKHLLHILYLSCFPSGLYSHINIWRRFTLHAYGKKLLGIISCIGFLLLLIWKSVLLQLNKLLQLGEDLKEIRLKLCFFSAFEWNMNQSDFAKRNLWCLWFLMLYGEKKWEMIQTNCIWNLAWLWVLNLAAPFCLNPLVWEISRSAAPNFQDILLNL